MNKTLFKTAFILLLINFCNSIADYYWTKVDHVGGGYFRSFCEDSSGNLYISLTYQIYKSTDDGNSWSVIYTISPNSSIKYLEYITSTDENILFVGGDSLFISYDQGASFINISPDIDTFRITYTNLCFLDSTLYLFKNKYKLKDENFYSYLICSKDLGENWATIDIFPGMGQWRTPIDLKTDNDGSLFFIIDTNNYYKKDILTEPKIIKHEKYIKHNDYFFISEGIGIFLINNYQLFKFDKKTFDLIEYSLPNIGFRDLTYHEGIFFCFRGTELYQSKDTMKTWEKVIEMKSGLALLPRLFVTRKGTILIGDFDTGLYIGRKVNRVLEKEEISFSISPNPAGEYIEIALSSPRLKPWVAGVDAIKIYNLLGECVLSVAQTFPSVDSGQTGMSDLLRIDVSGLPAGVYFVRVGDWVGRFLKI